MYSAVYTHTDAVPGEPTIHMFDWSDDDHTLCGLLTDDFIVGDETASGHAATCGSCKRVFNARQTQTERNS